ncbi:MAG: InlB B-repeat-containing protein [Clostridia bacterium]|nr:InlB B-repeat-containing protein [Clostridia bacterium]
MKKFLRLFCLCLVFILSVGFVSCKSDKKDQSKIYEVENKYFAQASYDTAVLTSMGVNGNQGSGTTYEIEVVSKCAVSLTEYTVKAKLYSANNTELYSFEKTVAKKIEANTEFNIREEITYNVYFAISHIEASFSGKSKENPNNASAFNETDAQVKPTVTFQTNGGTAVNSIRTNTITSPPTTSKSGCLFGGWYFDKSLVSPVSFPLSIEKNITLYAKWLNLTDTKTCEETSIKDWDGYSSSSTYYITPTGFDLELLASKQYYMQITVSYEVYYERDYDLPLGYAGSPKYEVFILNSDGLGTIEEDLPTTKTATRYSVTYRANMEDLKNQSITLKFSTDNIQNIIYFQNIIVTYSCKKSA